MTTDEMRELDAWISEHVMGGPKDLILSYMPTRNATDAMAVLKKCVERAVELDSHICMGGDNNQIEVWLNDNAGTQWHGEGETQEIAIVKFAKQLFSKP